MSNVPPTTPRTSRTLPAHTQRSPGTPRRRKSPRKRTTRPSLLTFEQTRQKIKDLLELDFEPDRWQIELIKRLREGYDSICVAGTGYGKSLVFQGLAALGGKQKVTIVICPLKALELDQVKGAIEKGLDAVAINEDNSDDPELWKRARTAQLLYLSPEMALGDGFAKMWREGRFRARVQAVIIDEAHCVDEWGLDFRPLYRQLHLLRSYTGQEVPFLACTATCTTGAFDTIWEALGYGHRDFSGLDVGCDRDNLLFLVRPFTDPKKIIYDILDILPHDMDTETPLSALPKTIIYFDSEAACRRAVEDLRKCLPHHLRGAVKPFSSDLSEEGKNACWNGFLNGDKYRILCATDAAGMGCNVPDVEYVIIVGCPKSLSAVMQRWGRAGRRRTVLGTCLLLVPKWAYRPRPPQAGLAVQRLKGKQKAKIEPKKHTEQRGRLQPELEKFVNLADEDPKPCSHAYLAEVFRPETGLRTHGGFAGPIADSDISRSTRSGYDLSHTVIDLHRSPNPERCCHHHGTAYKQILRASDPSDPRLTAFAGDFVRPLVRPPTRPSSAASNVSEASRGTDGSRRSLGSDADFAVLDGKFRIPADERERLRTLLEDWRETYDFGEVDTMFMSRRAYFPPKQLEKIVDGCARFLTEPVVTPRVIRQVVKWDSASDTLLEDLAIVLAGWRIGAAPLTTPKSQRQHKRARAAQVTEPIPQPVFALPEAGVRPLNHTAQLGDVFGTPTRTRQVHTPRTPQASSSQLCQPLSSPTSTPRAAAHPLRGSTLLHTPRRTLPVPQPSSSARPPAPAPPAQYPGFLATSLPQPMIPWPQYYVPPPFYSSPLAY